MISDTSIPGAFTFTPKLIGDERGKFAEWFKADAFTERVGHALSLQQANFSISSAGVIRGIHFADVPPGQAKYVMCPKGAVLDVIVDLRVGSPTFGHWDSIILDDINRRCVYVAEGLGHAFMSMEDGSTVVYLCSAKYAPGREHGISPFDEDLGIQWPTIGRGGRELRHFLSDKDATAPRLADALRGGWLPDYTKTARFVESLGKRRD